MTRYSREFSVQGPVPLTPELERLHHVDTLKVPVARLWDHVESECPSEEFDDLITTRIERGIVRAGLQSYRLTSIAIVLSGALFGLIVGTLVAWGLS